MSILICISDSLLFLPAFSNLINLFKNNVNAFSTITFFNNYKSQIRIFKLFSYLILSALFNKCVQLPNNFWEIWYVNSKLF